MLTYYAGCNPYPICFTAISQSARIGTSHHRDHTMHPTIEAAIAAATEAVAENPDTTGLEIRWVDNGTPDGAWQLYIDSL